MSHDFLLDALERLLKTGAQTLIAAFVGNATVVDLDWGGTLAIVGTAMLLSALTSVLSLKLGESGTASATAAVVPAEQAAADVQTAQTLATGDLPVTKHHVTPQTPGKADHAAGEE